MALYISGLLLCQNRVPKTKGKQLHENKPVKQTHTLCEAYSLCLFKNKYAEYGLV